jgi:phosphate-selective porin OprO/OprP
MFKIQGGTPELSSGTNLRWARLCLGGKVLTDWGYSFGYDFQPNNANRLTDAYIAYNGWQNMSLLVGQFTPNVSISSWTDDTDRSFLEIPLSTYLFTPDYSRGLAYDINNSQLALHASIWRPGVEQNFSGRTPLSASARFIYSPIHTQTHALSLGAAVWCSTTDGTRTVFYDAPPELATRNNNIVLNTSLIPNVKNATSSILEASYVRGPWSMQTEYIYNLVWRNMNSQNLRFNGCYAALGYFFTGESMNYSFPGGGFISLDHINNKRLGAWQIVARISYANLNDKDIIGGKETNTTLGLNWHINQYVALKTSYIRAIINLPNTGAHANSNIYALRAQVRF